MNTDALNKINAKQPQELTTEEQFNTAALDYVAECLDDATEYVAECLEDLAAWLRS